MIKSQKQKNNRIFKPKPGKFVGFLLVFLFLFAFSRNEAAGANFSYEGIAFYAYSDNSAVGAVPVYRFYNKIRGDHVYTISEKEKGAYVSTPTLGYVYEGIAFYTYKKQLGETVPVYRFRNKEKSDHVYTISEKEKNAYVSMPALGYVYEGIAFYGYKTQTEKTVPVYRFRNKTTNDHLYTASETEKESLLYQGLGPEISVGVWNYTKDELKSNPFQIEANESYKIKDKDGKLIATVTENTVTKVKYDSDGNLKIYNSIPEKIVSKEVIFESAKADGGTIVFDAHRPDSSYDKYRGKIKVRYSNASGKIWSINILPLEQYIWGIGEITGTGDEGYNRTMTAAFRTYGYWKVLYGTKYATEGFKVDATSSSQIYRGYEWEVAHPRIKQAAEYTQGKIAKYGSDIALSPYSSWTDGRTRSFYERWGSDDYPWCQSVKDLYGKHPSLTISQLVSAGNHMVGISAHGALKLATDYNWTWDKILKYYLTGINIAKIY